MLEVPETVERMEDDVERIQDFFLQALAAYLECGTLVDLGCEAEELSDCDADSNDDDRDNPEVAVRPLFTDFLICFGVVCGIVCVLVVLHSFFILTLVFRTFWSIMLPNARGVMVTVMLFSFVWQWNDVYYTSLLELSTNDFPLLTMKLLNTAERLPNFMKIYRLEQLVDPEIRGNSMFISLIANTAGFLMMLPLLVGYLFVQKLFVEGIERTGIVG